eukprot:2360725-Rhodomonas_salina.4
MQHGQSVQQPLNYEGYEVMEGVGIGSRKIMNASEAALLKANECCAKTRKEVMTREIQYESVPSVRSPREQTQHRSSSKSSWLRDRRGEPPGRNRMRASMRRRV